MDARPSPERAALRALADLCGRLLLREANAADLELLHRSEVRPALAALGVTVPGGPTEAVLDDLARQYRSTFSEPGPGASLLASSWGAGHPGGDVVAAARGAALAVGFDLDRAPAPTDHLGNLLRLWARADETLPELADRLRRRHLAWGIDALHDHAFGGASGFYPDLARAVIAVLAEITAD